MDIACFNTIVWARNWILSTATPDICLWYLISTIAALSRHIPYYLKGMYFMVYSGHIGMVVVTNDTTYNSYF